MTKKPTVQEALANLLTANQTPYIAVAGQGNPVDAAVKVIAAALGTTDTIPNLLRAQAVRLTEMASLIEAAMPPKEDEGAEEDAENEKPEPEEDGKKKKKKEEAKKE